MQKQPYRNALVLGAGGFIGVNLAWALAARGFSVTCFDRAISHHWPPGAKTITGDFAVPSPELIEAFKGALVFHLVSSSLPSTSTSCAADDVIADVASTLRYLEATKASETRWIFFSSGGTVYGPTDDLLIDEAKPTEPICSYGIVKITLERFFALYRKLYGTDYVIVRPSNPYGPWQSPFRKQGLIAVLLYKGLIGEPIEVWGDGETVRDYIYIEDVAEGSIAAGLWGKGGEIYNLGTGEGHSINALIDRVGATLGRPMTACYTPARTIDVRRNVLRTDKIKSHTGWAPKTALSKGLTLAAEWIQQNCF